MTTPAFEKTAWPAPCLRVLLPALITLLLLCAPAWGQSAWPPQDPGQTSDRLRKADPQPPRSPQPPVSAFSLQTHLRKYLETWPTPGATAAEEWPLYVPEEGEEEN